MAKPEDIDLVETAPGEWAADGDRTASSLPEPVPPPQEGLQPKRRGPIDDIPSVGSPIEFFTMFACLWFLAWLLHG